MGIHYNNSSKTLNELNHDEVMRQIPLVIYLTILCIVGIAGNSLVFYVYKTKYVDSTFRIFVMTLSLIDLFTSSAAIPFEIVSQFWQYTFTSAFVCKVSIMVSTWPSITSGILLLAIASDRYRKICKPFQLQLSCSAAKRTCIFILTLGMTASWMLPVIYGIQTRGHDTYNFTISECVVTDNMKETLFPFINNCIFTLLFIGSFGAIIVLYCFVVARVRKHVKRKLAIFKSRGKDQTKCSVGLQSISQKKADEKSNNTDKLDTNKTTSEQISSNAKYLADSDKRKSVQQQVEGHRTAVIMFVISIAFIVSYLPLLCLLLIRTSDKEFVASLTVGGRTAYKFLLRSYYLNCAINAVIYGIWDSRFKSACKQLCACKYIGDS